MPMKNAGRSFPLARTVMALLAAAFLAAAFTAACGAPARHPPEEPLAPRAALAAAGDAPERFRSAGAYRAPDSDFLANANARAVGGSGFSRQLFAMVHSRTLVLPYRSKNGDKPFSQPAQAVSRKSYL